MRDIAEYGVREIVLEDDRFVLYRARQASDGPDVLLKVARSGATPDGLAAFSADFFAARRCEVPAIPRPLHIDTTQTAGAFQVRRYVTGRPLSLWIDGRMPRPSLGESLQIASILLAALESIHARGFVHCDVGPRNLLYDYEGRAVYFADCAWMRGAGGTSRANPVPNATYLAPEQSLDDDRQVDARADLYSAGVILHQLLTGVLLADGSEVAATVARDGAMPPGLKAILLKLLQSNRADRYATATETRKDLARCLDSWRASGVLPDVIPSVSQPAPTVHFPEEMVGRGAVRSALHDCLVDAARGAATLVLLTGAGGSGKSTILGDVKRRARTFDGLVLCGGWTPYDRHVPFRGLTSMCDQLLEWWSTLNRDEREHIATTLRQVLGDGCGIVTDTFPALETILGIQPLPPGSGTIERRNRLTHCLTSLLAALGSPERPVVLLLEDLQWADAASLPIIEGLPGRSAARNLLTVASIRTGTDGADETFVTGLARAAEEHGQTVRALFVCQFDVADTASFLASALGITSAEIEPLAVTLTELSLGNPLAVRELLASATAQGLITFDHGADRWTWSIEDIRRCHLPEDVAHILANRLSSLTPQELTALRAAACVGSRFDGAPIARLLEWSPAETRAVLDGCVAAGFLLPVATDRAHESIATYQFRHELVQSAAYAGLPASMQERLHATMGAWLLARYEATGSADSLYEALTHLNRSYTLRHGADDLALARRNLEGAELAHHATAYDTAAQLLGYSDRQLPPDIWSTDPDLAFKTSLLRIDCEYLSKRSAAAEQAYVALLAHDLDNERRITALMTHMRMLSNMGRFDESASDGLACLRLLGLDLPHPARRFQLIGPMLGAMLRNGRLPPEPDQVQLRTLDDGTAATLACLADLWGPAFWIDENLTGLVVFAMVRLSLTRGNCAASAIGYASYGVFLAQALKRQRLGQRVCALGVSVAEKAGDPVYLGRARFMYEAFFGHLEKPLRQAPAVFRQLVDGCLRGGDYPYAGASANMFLYYLPVVGIPLTEFMAEAREIVGMARQTEQSRTIVTVDILRRWIEILEGRAQHAVPSFSAENAFIEGRLNESERGLYHLFEISLFYFLEDYESAVTHIECLPGNKMLSGYFAHYYAFFSGLILARRRAAGSDRRTLRRFGQYRRQLFRVAGASPENYLHMALVLDGVGAVLRGRDRDAIPLLEKAIADANQKGFSQNAAIAAEWLAECLERQGESIAAGRALTRARHWYHQWGCLVKVGAMDRRQPPHVTPAREVPNVAPSSSEEEWPTNARSVLDAARTLSNEAVPARLADRLIVAIVDHTKATRAVLLIRDDSDLAVACERLAASTGRDGRSRELSKPRDDMDLPQLMINYADRLGRPVRLTASAEHDLFGRDPYMLHHPGMSLLCVPLMHMRQSLGVLFLEKDEQGTGFTQADLVTAEILAAQAAATLSNQREYNERLAALQNQIQPHFLFNALTGIAELTVVDPPRAERAILGLATLYRNILISSRHPHVTLKEELELVGSYLELEKLRFGPRLSYRVMVQGDPSTAVIPPLVIQPLVENAVHHGIAPKAEGGLVTIEAVIAERRVHVRVSDSGVGWNAGANGHGAGLGLQSIRRRLRLAFGNEAELSIVRSAGVTVDLFVPLVSPPALQMAASSPEPRIAPPNASSQGSATLRIPT